MHSFYTHLFSETQLQDSQMAALARITRLSNDRLRSMAGDILWSLWN